MTSRVKAVFVGDTGVGKTCIISRVTRNEFVESQATVGAANVDISIDIDNGKKLNFSIWDTAGQERYRALAPMYFSGAALAFCVYDITRLDSLDALRVFIEMLQQKSPSYIKYVLVGNKTDLENERAISQSQAEQFQLEIGADFFMEVSAKTGNGVSELFTRAAMINDLHTEESYGDLDLKSNEEGDKDAAQRKKCAC